MRILALLLLFSLWLTTPAHALSPELERELGVAAVEEGAPEAAREINGELDLRGYDVNGALSRLWRAAMDALRSGWGAAFALAASLAMIGLGGALARSVCAAKPMEELIELVSCAAAGSVCIGGLDGVIERSSSAIAQLSDYSRAVLPAMFTASAVCGAAVSAPAKYAAACLAMDVLISAAQELVIPLIRAFLALSVGSALFSSPLTQSAARLVKWLATTLMSALTLGFGAYLTLTGLIAGSTDALAVKTARTVISTALPVVGGILADASASMLAAASVIKASAGAFALIAVCALCLAPVAEAMLRLLAFKAASAVCSVSGGERLGKLVSEVGTAMGLLLGLIGCCAAMLFISVTSAIRAVTL